MSVRDTNRWFCCSVHRKVSGVCAGMAAYYQQPRWLMRLLAVMLLLMFPVVTILGYFVAAAVLPER